MFKPLIYQYFTSPRVIELLIIGYMEATEQGALNE